MKGSRQESGNTRWHRYVAVVMAVAASGWSGCARSFYRLDADRESYQILAEKTADPRWAVPAVSIEPSPQSRNFDPTSPDRPPLPPDDSAAHRYMHRADGKRGYHGWHKQGDAPSIEDPGWRDYLELDEDGKVSLDPDRAVKLGLLNSREYQFELESLYLAALALTLERFDFDLHGFGINRTDYEHFGKSSTPDETNTLTTQSNLGFSRAFTTGGELLVDFANTFVWEFTGANRHFGFSNLAIGLVQPLLRRAFRDVAMEGLTQAERDVLYAARGFARFRKEFYVDLVSGGRGYLSLLLQLQAIRNQEANLFSLEQNLRAHEALADAGIVSLIQVDQVFQRYQEGRLSLIRANNTLETSLDAYKIRLGLPPEMDVTVDDSLLAPFQLNSNEVAVLEKEVEQLLVEFRERDQAPSEPVLRAGFDSLQILNRRLVKQVVQVQGELERWKSQEDESSDDDPLAEARKNETQVALADRLTELAKDIEDANHHIGEVASGISTVSPDESWQAIQRLAREQSAQISDIFVVQTQIRAFLVRLRPVSDDQEQAVDQALANRLDLMNQRAQVVDAWRKIRVAADGLQSDLDIVFDADIATKPGSANPLKFSSESSRYRAGIRLDGPLNRKAERNIYRAQLVEYQRSRRDFMATRDAMVQEIRRNLRNLAVDRLNFEITRQRLIVAARQVELARMQLLAPGQVGDSSFTRDALDALNSLLDAKDALIANWVSYETNRLQLLLNTGALTLDDQGLFHDEQLDRNSEPEPIDTPQPVVFTVRSDDEPSFP